MKCPSCQTEVLDIDVKCPACGAALSSSGAHRMIGGVVLGTYEVVDVLGQGGMSVVFKARHKLTEQEVALKILPPELAAHSQVKGRFLDEAKALAALDHPNIVHLYNFGQENGSFVLAMQFVQGATWERMILENKRLDWKLTCRIAVDVLKALEYAHGRGVVHRDMKPSNVLVRATDGAATVMDFGIAKMTTSSKLTATGQTMGTVRYMSPEQVRGQEVDLRTDIYSLGATIYESLVGDTPFDGSTHFEIMTKHLTEAPKPPSSHGVELPQDVEDALMRSLAKKAPDRFESARDMRKIIEAALKAGDVGLVETQRMQRDAVGANAGAVPRPAASIGLAATSRATSASDLADELEPGATGEPKRVRPRAKWPYLVLLVLLLGAGGGAAAILLRDQGKAGYKSRARIKGVKLTAGAQFGQLFVETDGRVTPADAADAYQTSLTELLAFETAVGGQRDVVQGIVALPGAALCAAAPLAAAVDCDTAKGAVLVTGKKTYALLVATDRGPLKESMRAGLARAVCDLQPNHMTESDDPRKLEQICAMTKRFAPVQ